MTRVILAACPSKQALKSDPEEETKALPRQPQDSISVSALTLDQRLQTDSNKEEAKIAAGNRHPMHSDNVSLKPD